MYEKTNYCIRTYIDSGYLSPGSYFLNFEFIQFDDACNVIFHDQVINSVPFEVESNPKMIWYSQYWGNISMIPVSIKKEKYLNGE